MWVKAAADLFQRYWYGCYYSKACFRDPEEHAFLLPGTPRREDHLHVMLACTHVCTPGAVLDVNITATRSRCSSRHTQVPVVL